MEFLFDLEDPLQCLERIYLQLSPLVVSLHPERPDGKCGPCFGNGMLLKYRDECFLITTEAVLSQYSIQHRQQAFAMQGKRRLPLYGLPYAAAQHMEAAAIHLPADWLAKHPLQNCFELSAGPTPDPLASAFTLLLGMPVIGPRPACAPSGPIGIVSRAYRCHTRGSQVVQPWHVEFDSQDIISRSHLDKHTLLTRYQMPGAPAISLYHSFKQDGNRLTAYMQGLVMEWDHNGAGAVLCGAISLTVFLDSFLQRLRQGEPSVPELLAELLNRHFH
ncbi:hypothetical protein [Chromobacterium sp. IIBBL 290-4]|uniref:hypothetical protein n=1 Tax=Chromobacterium sp. IIBBL 290-4 TaxID=2953890 RepID=UPI0020B6C0DA|nr:hypothetical protein [Chromobacterium sp. IIBBL 290-4]UTH73382.1 hypothetical protein NKT35_17845 [Chromobacterium sp. IIBBL 290-4]